MNTFMHILPWVFAALAAWFTVYHGLKLVRFVKLCRKRTAVYESAIAADLRGDDEEFKRLYAEWDRLATECERRMGIKKKADATNPFRSAPL